MRRLLHWSPIVSVLKRWHIGNRKWLSAFARCAGASLLPRSQLIGTEEEVLDLLDRRKGRGVRSTPATLHACKALCPVNEGLLLRATNISVWILYFTTVIHHFIVDLWRIVAAWVSVGHSHGVSVLEWAMSRLYCIHILSRLVLMISNHIVVLIHLNFISYTTKDWWVQILLILDVEKIKRYFSLSKGCIRYKRFIPHIILSCQIIFIFVNVLVFHFHSRDLALNSHLIPTSFWSCILSFGKKRILWEGRFLTISYPFHRIIVFIIWVIVDRFVLVNFEHPIGCMVAWVATTSKLSLFTFLLNTLFCPQKIANSTIGLVH